MTTEDRIQDLLARNTELVEQRRARDREIDELKGRLLDAHGASEGWKATALAQDRVLDVAMRALESLRTDHRIEAFEAYRKLRPGSGDFKWRLGPHGFEADCRTCGIAYRAFDWAQSLAFDPCPHPLGVG